MAIGERVDAKLAQGCGILTNQDGTVKVEKFNLKTNLNRVYAGGDLVMGPATAVEAMSDGKKAAQAIDRELTGEERFYKLFSKIGQPFNVTAKRSRLAD